MNLAVGGKPAEPVEFVSRVVLSREFKPRSFADTRISRWSTSDQLANPLGVFGLEDLLDSILESGSAKANRMWQEIGWADIRISLPSRAAARSGCGFSTH